MAKVVQIIALLVLVVVPAFVAGVWVRDHDLWPAQELTEAQRWWDRYRATGTFSPANRVFAPAAGVPDSDMRGMENNHSNKGYLAIEAWFEGEREYGIRLLDRDRNTVHYWPLDYDEYDPDGPRNNSEQPHGMQLLPDGSVIVVFGKGDVLVRIDQCGKPMWIKQGVYHHLPNFGNDGMLWVWEGENSELAQFQKIVKIDIDTGKTLHTIDFNEEVIRKHGYWDLFGLEENFPFKKFEFEPKARDNIFHPNDVEPLPQELATTFPMFNPGDLLVSLRKPNFIGVIDSDSGEVLWHMNGPWKTQHDPDFGKDGLITLYNNRIESYRSAIMSVNPRNDEVQELFKESNLLFLSKFMGVHQRLPHDRTLIVVPEEGRVMEVGPDGAILFEFINRVNDKALGHVQNAMWVDDDFFDTVPQCQ